MSRSTRSMAEYHNPAYIPFRDLVLATGLSERTVRKRLRDGGVPVYASPADSRYRLVLRAELAGLFDVPRLIERPRERSEEAA